MMLALLGLALAAETPCDSEAYVRLDAGPVPVFASPGDAEPVGALPAYRPAQVKTDAHKGLSGGPRLALVAASGDWVKYTSAKGWTEPADPKAPPAPAKGWIRADALHVDLAMSEVSPALAPPWVVVLRASPTLDAPVVRTWTQQSHVAVVRSCRGSWLSVDVTVGVGTHRGWLHEQDWCANAVSTCSTKGGSASLER